MNNEKTKKLKTQPYKGARDFYPADMRVQNYIYDIWKKVCKRYGFEQYDFPIMEPFEIFAAKSGEELVNEQIFTLEDKGGRKLAIRPELTPGTVRMLAQKYNEVPQPIKWFMIGNNWRFEKPQLGRGREFYQLEVNIFGVEDVLADFEIFSIIIDIMREFGATDKQYEIQVSDRRLINALLSDTLKLDQSGQVKVRRIMDKRLKMDKETFLKELRDLGLTEKQADTVEQFMASDLESLQSIIAPQVLEQNMGYIAIKALFKLLKESGLDEYCRFSPSIIRGFDYSDGVVYEVFDKNPKNKRSLFGGERFDKLINIFGDFNLPATGFAMGDYTLSEFLQGWGLLPQFEGETDYLVALWPLADEKYLQKTMEISSALREKGKNCFTWIEPNTKLDRQLKYADKKNIPFVVIIGEEELQTEAVTIKNLKTREQKTLPVDKFLNSL